MKKVWGAVSMSTCYHSSPNCTHLINRSDLSTPCYVVEYKDEQHAFETGHLRPCSHCAGAKTVEDEEMGMVQLTVEQIDTLKAIRKIYITKKSPITLSEIAKERGRTISTCHRIVNMLTRKGLVLKRMGAKGRKAMNGSILPTAAIGRVIDRLA